LKERAQALLDGGLQEMARPDDGADSDIGNADDGDFVDDEVASRPRRRTRWQELDRQRLKVWIKEGKDWDWIFQQFPGRSEAAVRAQAYLLSKG
jgi:hypothetical protein